MICLGIVFSFYGLFYIYIVAYNDSAIHAIESKLYTQVIPVEKVSAEKKEEPEKIQETEHGKKQAENKDTELPLVIEGLTETTATGTVPIIRPADQKTSFHAYKKPFSYVKNGKPVLAIIVTDFGLSKSATQTALDILPENVSFSVSPYIDLPKELAKILRQSGREFWLNVPFENLDEIKSDNGKYSILTRESFINNQKTFHSILNQSQSFPGISAYAAKQYLQQSQNLQFKKITEEAFARGLGYLELNPKADATLANIALMQNAPYIKADTEIIFATDHDPFEELETILQTKGYAVAVIQSYPQNIKRLAEWILKVAQIDYELAPVSAIYELPLHLNAPANSTLPALTQAPPLQISTPAQSLQPSANSTTGAGTLLNNDKVLPPIHENE